MSFFRLILFFILAYLLVKVARKLLFPADKGSHVSGDATGSEPLDLSKEDVEDVDFEEIDTK